MSALLRALLVRLRTPRRETSALVMPLRGGSGSLVQRRIARRLISTATSGDAAAPSKGMAGWLERIQATRSALLVVPDRQTGVAIALRWRLSPEKLRLEDDLAGGSTEGVAATGAARPWHAPGNPDAP